MAFKVEGSGEGVGPETICEHASMQAWTRRQLDNCERGVRGMLSIALSEKGQTESRKEKGETS